MQRRRNIYLLGQATSGKGKGERCVGAAGKRAGGRTTQQQLLLYVCTWADLEGIVEKSKGRWGS